LGTNYGGDGQVTFALPDLRGRLAVSSGQGPGLSNYQLGQVGGQENVPLTVNELPSHNHAVSVHGGNSGSPSPTGRLPGRASTGTVYARNSNGEFMAPQTINPTGSSQPHTNVQPYLTLNYCIALEGIYPSRN
jgi:microcystin-dependent protein